MNVLLALLALNFLLLITILVLSAFLLKVKSKSSNYQESARDMQKIKEQII